MSRFESWALHVLALLVTASGVLYFCTKHLVRHDDPFSVVHHPLQAPALALHVLASPLLVLGFGSAIRSHAVGKLAARTRANRRSGMIVLAAILPMIVSGYLLEVLSGAAALRWTVVVHVASSIVFAVAYLIHAIVSLRIAQRLMEAA